MDRFSARDSPRVRVRLEEVDLTDLLVFPSTRTAVAAADEERQPFNSLRLATNAAASRYHQPMVIQWGEVFGEVIIPAAVLAPLLHHSQALVVQGESHRLKRKKRADLVARNLA